jgi:hypothetical protein
MPLQNRVTPFGELVAIPDYGAWMGNRGGCMHTSERKLTRRRWVSRRWIVCVLEFRGRRRTVMTPVRYTELFFLDEATALAAGHRPCRECRYADHQRFKAAWLRGNRRKDMGPFARIDAIDAVLHQQRVTRQGAKVTYRSRLAELPEGIFITLAEEPAAALLVTHKSLWRWTPRGYMDAGPCHRVRSAVTVLTPRSIVAAIQAGYVPQWHSSAT